MQVQLGSRLTVDGRLGLGDPLQRGDRLALDLLRNSSLLNRIEQLPDPPAGSVLGVDNHPGATEVTTLPAAHVDRHLVSQPQRGDGRIQHRLVCARVDQRTQSHVPGDA